MQARKLLRMEFLHLMSYHQKAHVPETCTMDSGSCKGGTEVLTRPKIDQVILEWKTCEGFHTLHKVFIELSLELSRVHKPSLETLQSCAGRGTLCGLIGYQFHVGGG